jgi:hypothetical protein
MQRLIWMLLLALLAVDTAATPGQDVQVPDALKQWVPWVLQDRQAQRCTPSNAGQLRICDWPGALVIELSEQTGSFRQTFALEAPGWVLLPGDTTHWPLDVLIDDAPAPVTEHHGRPAIFFSPPTLDPGGWYQASGRFVWKQLPDALSLPPASALISASLNGQALSAQAIDEDNRLWLRKSGTGQDTAAEPRSTSLQVFRKFTDDVPMGMETRLVLDISQQAGELVVGPALLPGFIAHDIDSPLPARLDAEQRLRLQVRPGRWTIRINARHPQPTTQLTVPTGLAAPWPAEETWVFEPLPELRLVEPTGLPPLDPRQTRTPPEWKQLSTFRAGAGESLTLRVERRGDPEPEPDRLSLQRDMWLDFSGAGYSVRDHISGTLARSWRLRSTDELHLGQVTINGQPQLITTRDDDPQQGVEVRHGQLQLTADGLMPGNRDQPSENGWLLDFQHTETRLHLPPGWTLLTAIGMDNIPDTWVQRWSLMDLFLVLLIVIGGIKAWGWGIGLLFLPALALTWQTPAAPQYAWLTVLAASALRQAVPAATHPRLAKSIAAFLFISLATLLIMLFPYLVQQMKTGLFPQLERPWQSLAEPSPDAAAPMVEEALPAAPVMQKIRAEKPQQRHIASLGGYADSYQAKSSSLRQLDPDAKVQTGPGVPDWHWRQVAFQWNGPVSQHERLHFILLPPFATGLVKILGALLLALLASLLLRREWHQRRAAARRRTTAAALLLLPLSLPASAALVEATAYPPQALLQELEQRLMRPEPCLPHCADIPRMSLQASGSQLRIMLQVDAQQTSAIPVPAAKERWRIEQAIVDGNDERQRLRREGEHLWIRVPQGRHHIELSGSLDGNAPITLNLPLLPRLAEVSLRDGWSLQGIANDGRPAHQIQLLRLPDADNAAPTDSEASELLPDLSLQRTLQLDLDWRIHNRLRRLSSADSPVLIKIPLVSGESVLSEAVKSDGAFAVVAMPPGQTEVSWESSLEHRERLTLNAGHDPQLRETWELDASTLWHVEASGIPPIHRQGQQQRWLPAWRPWPGESVAWRIDRPRSVPGQTFTIDRAALRLRPGKRLGEATLELSLRAAQGGQHSFQLPPGATLQQLRIDGQPYPARQEGDLITLPIRPGAMQVQIEWRDAQAMRRRFASPAVRLNSPAVNASTHIAVGQERWIVWVSGDGIGPAVQFWGVLLVILIAAPLLGRIKTTPLRGRDWFLLGIGLSQTNVIGALLPVVWLFALGARKNAPPTNTAGHFNVLQLALALLSMMALSALFAAVQQGLLGAPSMHIGGNASNASELSWYVDRIAGGNLPSAHIYSLPILAYRLLMLAWALWLAFKLVGWIKWGWQAYASPTLWRKLEFRWPDWKRKTAKTPPHADDAETNPEKG